MFNRKDKQHIAELTATNENLQKQYDFVHGLLLQRQDEVMALRRELGAVQTAVTNKLPDNFREEVKKIVKRETQGILSENTEKYISDEVVDYVFEFFDSDSDSEDDEDEDEDEDDGGNDTD